MDKKEKNKMNNRKKKLLIVSMILVIASIVATVILLSSKSESKTDDKIVQTGLALDDFYSDNCKCLERENFRCWNSSFQLNREKRLCIYGNKITNVILGCSTYDCNGTLYKFNIDINLWEANK